MNGSDPLPHPAAGTEHTLGATALWAAIPARALAAQRLVRHEGMLFAAFVQLTGGALLAGFALALGAGPATIGLLTSLPLLARLSQLYISWRVERAGHWPRSALFGASVGRLTVGVPALVVFLPVSNDVRLVVLVTAMTIAAVGTATFELAFLTWMAELVPSRIRNVFFAHRSRTMGLFGMAAALVAAGLLDWWRRERPGSIDGFAAVFATAMALGAISLLVMRRIPHPRRQQTRVEEVRLRDALAGPLRDRGFRPLLYFGGVYGVGLGLLNPHLTVYLLRELDLSFIAVTALAATSTLSSALTNTSWGRLADHFGTKTIVYAGALLLCWNPLLMLGVPALGLWLLVAMHLLSGVASSAFEAPLNTLVLSMARPDARPSYLAAFVGCYAAGQALGAMLGGLGLRAAAASGLSSEESFALLFAIAVLVRLGGSQLLGYVRERGAAPVGHMIRVMGRARSMSTTLPIDPLLRHGSLHLARFADFIARDREREDPVA